MILPSTIRKMQARGQSVFRVTVEAHSVSLPAGTVNCPERRDYFATRTGAAKHVAMCDPAMYGARDVKVRIEEIPSAKLDPFWGQEI